MIEVEPYSYSAMIAYVEDMTGQEWGLDLGPSEDGPSRLIAAYNAAQ